MYVLVSFICFDKYPEEKKFGEEGVCFAYNWSLSSIIVENSRMSKVERKAYIKRNAYIHAYYVTHILHSYMIHFPNPGNDTAHSGVGLST